MARTNKMGILKKKQQQAKQKRMLDESGVEGEISFKREYTNTKGNSYIRFLRGSKFYCDQTSVREDPDGFRILRQANGGEINFEYRGENSWGFRKWRNKFRRMGNK